MARNIVSVSVLVLSLFGYIKYLESHGIYLPAKEIDATPAAVGLAFEEVFLKTEDNRTICGWFVPHSNAACAVLFCHGNAGNIGHRLDKIQILRAQEADVFIFDYRGFGKSEGRPSERGIYLDTRAAYEYLVTVRNIPPARIIIYGESLGTAAAVELASREKTGGIILEGAFSSGRDMARKLYPFMPPWLFSNMYDSLGRIRAVSAPALFIHSRDDEIVPLRLAQKLYEAASGKKTFVELRGGHNSAFAESDDEYWAAVSAFIEGVRKQDEQGRG